MGELCSYLFVCLEWVFKFWPLFLRQPPGYSCWSPRLPKPYNQMHTDACQSNGVWNRTSLRSGKWNLWGQPSSYKIDICSSFSFPPCLRYRQSHCHRWRSIHPFEELEQWCQQSQGFQQLRQLKRSWQQLTHWNLGRMRSCWIPPRWRGLPYFLEWGPARLACWWVEPASSSHAPCNTRSTAPRCQLCCRSRNRFCRKWDVTVARYRL